MTGKPAIFNPQASQMNAPLYFLGIRPVEIIAMHKAPDMDSITAQVLLRMYGEKAFPGIRNAEVRFWGVNGTPDGQPPSAWLIDKKVLSVDCGGSIFDEHKTGGIGRIAPDTCATKLVAEYLGLDQKPELQQLLRFVTNSDNKTGTSMDSIASIIKAMHGNGDDPKQVVAWASKGIEAILKEQERFWACEEELETKTMWYEVPMPNGKSIMMVAVDSDNTSMHRFARMKKSDPRKVAKIVIQRNSRGQCTIFGTPGIRFGEIAKLIRSAELEAQGKPQTGADLTSAGTLDEVPEWHLMIGNNNDILLNGSPTHPDVPPTKLSRDAIAKCVIDALKAH